MQDKVKRYIDAVTLPPAPPIALKVFNFLMKYKHRATRYVPAMSPIPHYVDIVYLDKPARKHGIDIYRYEFAVSLIENKIFEKFNKAKK